MVAKIVFSLSKNPRWRPYQLVDQHLKYLPHVISSYVRIWHITIIIMRTGVRVDFHMQWHEALRFFDCNSRYHKISKTQLAILKSNMALSSFYLVFYNVNLLPYVTLKKVRTYHFEFFFVTQCIWIYIKIETAAMMLNSRPFWIPIWRLLIALSYYGA